MNTTIAFPAAKPELKLPSHPAERNEARSTLPADVEERRRLEEDHAALRERELNLRDYEARLRTWQAQIENGFSHPAPQRSAPSAEGEAALYAAWDKLHRARELLEVEQAHLLDDRLNLKEAAAGLKRREEAMTAREARLIEREDQLAAAQAAFQAENEKVPSAMARLTQAPFAMAKSVFGGKGK